MFTITLLVILFIVSFFLKNAKGKFSQNNDGKKIQLQEELENLLQRSEIESQLKDLQETSGIQFQERKEDVVYLNGKPLKVKQGSYEEQPRRNKLAILIALILIALFIITLMMQLNPNEMLTMMGRQT